MTLIDLAMSMVVMGPPPPNLTIATNLWAKFLICGTNDFKDGQYNLLPSPASPPILYVCVPAAQYPLPRFQAPISYQHIRKSSWRGPLLPHEVLLQDQTNNEPATMLQSFQSSECSKCPQSWRYAGQEWNRRHLESQSCLLCRSCTSARPAEVVPRGKLLSSPSLLRAQRSQVFYGPSQDGT